MNFRILAINPGSTSTKIAVYDDSKEIFRQSISHTPDEIAKFSQVLDQFEWRNDLDRKSVV